MTATNLPSGQEAAPQRQTGLEVGITIYGCEQDEAALFEEMAPRLGALPTIVAEPLVEGNARVARENQCISVGHKTLVTPPTLLALSHAGVRYISTRSVGCDHIDADYAASVGITVDTVAYSPDSVADYTLMLMLMALRQVTSVIRRSDVHDYRLHDARGRELRDLTVGVIGTGRIGAAVINRLQGFGCRILAHDVRPQTAAAYVSLDALIEQSDVVTLHTPLTDETHHLLDGHRIARMKPGAVIVNTGRGPLLDTTALVSALESGALGGAALDVVEGEAGIFYADRSRTPIHDRLWLALHRLPNVLITPHIAYYTDHALRDTVENSIRNCLRFQSEQPRG